MAKQNNKKSGKVSDSKKGKKGNLTEHKRDGNSAKKGTGSDDRPKSRDN